MSRYASGVTATELAVRSVLSNQLTTWGQTHHLKTELDDPVGHNGVGGAGNDVDLWELL